MSKPFLCSTPVRNGNGNCKLRILVLFTSTNPRLSTPKRKRWQGEQQLDAIRSLELSYDAPSQTSRTAVAQQWRMATPTHTQSFSGYWRLLKHDNLDAFLKVFDNTPLQATPIEFAH